MRVAIIGIRGVPANYGGLEECAEEVGARLAKRGHEVLVYCRRGSYDDSVGEYRGMRRIVLPSIETKAADTYSHSMLAMLHVLRQKPDVMLAFNPGIASLCVIPKLAGIPIALNPDGFDWRREKWGRVAKSFIHVSARLCGRLSDQMVMDAASVRDYYNEAFNCRPPAVYIPNGTAIEPVEHSSVPAAETDAVLRSYQVEKDEYVLFLSRHVPENSCEYVLEAFGKLDCNLKLLFGGTGAYGGEYAEHLRRRFESERVLFPGPIYDQEQVKVLHHNCRFVVHGNQPGGTSLGLLKAIGLGTCVLTLDTTDNAYVVGDAGCIYKLNVDDLREKMQELVDNPAVVADKRRRAVRRAEEEYRWEIVADKYEAVLSGLAAGGRRTQRRAS